ncbi:MAG TPA: cytochrome P450 [Herpetosiphonaceae bacterium]
MLRSPPHPTAPPGQSGWPVIGEIREWLADPLAFAQERAARHGPVWRTHLLGRPCVVLLGPEGNQFMLASGARHFSWRQGWGRAMLDLMGGGLSLLDGHEHDERRRIVRPALGHAALRDQLPAIRRLVTDHCAAWAAAGRLALFDGLKTLAFDVALLTVCGPVSPALARRLHADFDAFTAGLFTPLALNLPGTTYGRAKRAARRLRRALGELIRERRSEPLPAPLDALSLMLAPDQGGPPPSDREICSELLLLLWAGHDTVASLLTWICYELARQPELADRARAEISQAVGDDPAGAEQLRQLPLLDRIIKEGERVHPPAPGGFRGVCESFEYGGWTIPQGWLAMYSTVYTHNMPELWREPGRFDPDRYAAPREEGHGVPFSLVGFGGGPRICIGLALAQMEMRLVLLELLRGYAWELEDGQSFERVWLPTNQPRDKLLVRLRRR